MCSSGNLFSPVYNCKESFIYRTDYILTFEFANKDIIPFNGIDVKIYELDPTFKIYCVDDFFGRLEEFREDNSTPSDKNSASCN